MKLVSIIMPAYNSKKFIKYAIGSILGQTYNNFELLIADDFSSDGTKKIINSYNDSRIKTFHNEKNNGYLQTFNKLIAVAKGDYITFQDADDYSKSNRLELLVNELEKNHDIGICGSNFIRIDENGRQIEVSDFTLNHNEIFEGMPVIYNFIGSALMIRREVYEKIGGYHPFFGRMGQEDHYWVYLALQNFKIKNLQEHLYFYRFNPESVSGNLSGNPSKLNSQRIVELLIKQQKETGSDMLLQGKDTELLAILDEMNKPFIDNPSSYFYYIAKRRFYEGNKKIAIKNILKAILLKPLKTSYYKDFLYFLRHNA